MTIGSDTVEKGSMATINDERVSNIFDEGLEDSRSKLDPMTSMKVMLG